MSFGRLVYLEQFQPPTCFSNMSQQDVQLRPSFVCLTVLFYSSADLSSEVTVVRASDWLLICLTPPTIACREEKWSVVEMWWKIKSLVLSPTQHG